MGGLIVTTIKEVNCITGVVTEREATPEELAQMVREPTPEQIQQAITTATQQRLDDFARTRRYSNTDSLSKYKDITDEEIAALPTEEQIVVTRYRAECRYLVLKVAQTWAVLERIEQEVLAGTRPMPTGYADIEPELPVLVWPV